MSEEPDRSSSRRWDTVAGWGRTAPARVLRTPVHDADGVARAFTEAPARGVLARGLGRSYGDAAQNSGGMVLDCRGITGPVTLDTSEGRLTAPAGAAIGELLDLVLQHGWVVPVLPGTRHVTLGGAIAADVHGKNHVQDGTLGGWVEEIVVVLGSGELCRLDPVQTPGAFWATVGGMGLTGVIVAATLRLLRVAGSALRVDTTRAKDLDDLLGLLRAGPHRYSVAWVDCLSTGRRFGRGIVTAGDFSADPSGAGAPGRPRAGTRLAVPVLPVGPLSPPLVRAFNAAYFASSSRRAEAEPQSLARFFHPLDGIGAWNRLYGPRGFVQYQFVVPISRDDVIEAALERLAEAGAPPYLAVLKELGPAGRGPLSFPQPGWTLAIDIPVGPPRLREVLDRVDEQIAAAGGRVYLAKDARMRSDLLSAMYPRLGEWRASRERLDPEHRLHSDLARRLGLAAV